MKSILILATTLALSGCATVEKYTENIASCSLDKTELLITSMYGPIGLSSKVRKADAAVACASPAK